MPTTQWPTPRMSVFLQVPCNSVNIWSVLHAQYTYPHFVLKLNSKLACLLQINFYQYSDVDILKQLYVAFICPNPDVWDPHLSKAKQELESVQHFACKVCTKSWDDAYSDMLRTLNIPHALSERRKLH